MPKNAGIILPAPGSPLFAPRRTSRERPLNLHSTWLVLPTLNEAENLPRMLEAIRSVAPGVHVLVVDDLSRDGTGDLAEACASRLGGIEVLHREGRPGYGQALTAGFRHAMAQGAGGLLTLDCDFSHDPSDIPRILTRLRDADIVVGSRYAPGGSIRDWPFHRRALSATANAFVRGLFGLPTRDCTSGYRAYRKEALADLPWDRLHSPGYSFLVEVLYWATRSAGRRVAEVPICYTDRKSGKSKMGPREIFFGAANLLKLRAQLLMRSAG